MNVGDDVDAYIEPNFIFSSGLTDNGLYTFWNMPKETEFGFHSCYILEICLKALEFHYFDTIADNSSCLYCSQ